VADILQFFSFSQGDCIDVEMYHDIHLQCNCLQLMKVVNNAIYATLIIKLFNPLKPELNPICYLLALLGAHHFLHVSGIRVKLLTFKRLMSNIYMYMEHPFLMFLDHTERRSTVGRTPLDE
jgi:hypothetical protein